jgi:hypothetical protein
MPAISLGMPLPQVNPREPRLGRWGDIFLRQGGGESHYCYHTDDFWGWWERQVPAFEQFPYAGLDFRHDPELVLPPGGAWGDIGMFTFLRIYLIFSNFSNI